MSNAFWQGCVDSPAIIAAARQALPPKLGIAAGFPRFSANRCRVHGHTMPGTDDAMKQADAGRQQDNSRQSRRT